MTMVCGALGAGVGLATETVEPVKRSASPGLTVGVGARVAKHTITDVWMSPFPSYEDMRLKPQ